MSNPVSCTRQNRLSQRPFGRASLLATASVLALLVHAAPAHAVCLGRCGAGVSTSAATAAATAAITSAQQAAALAQHSMNSLTRATLAVQAMQAAQSAARAAAAAGANNLGQDPNHPGLQLPNVPDGLSAGGLVPDSGLAASGVANAVTSWVNAGTPTQTVSGGQTLVAIQQTAPQAVLNWTTFNIGKNTTVSFNQQGNAGWIALNKINDPSGVPSQILGRIKADGQVLLINQNGIIFGGSSQINVNALIASTRDDSSLNTNNYQIFLQNGLFSGGLPTGYSGTATATFDRPGSQGMGAVTVQPGAIINASANAGAAGNGGYVALIGGSVNNAGTIAAQNGQVILAADSSVTLITPTSSAVGVATAIQVIGGSGAVTNSANGLLISNDGAVTLAGGAINQFGGILATTSVTRTGSISLASPGNVVLGTGSLTAILPDESGGTLPTASANNQSTSANGSTGPYFQGILQPQITIAAASIDVQSGATIKAPSAALAMSVSASVLLETGSTIDLSGLAGVTLPMSLNEVSILITANEVADTPLARGLIGKTVTIDARLSGTRADGLQWVGSPLLDAAGYVGLVPETIDEILTRGGSFSISAPGGALIQQPGSVINVSGGYVAYLGGIINTTRLVGSNGRLYDIGSADPSLSYVILGGFTVDHPHWNVVETYTNPLISGGHYEPGYIAGASAGSIGITAQWPILEGVIVGDIVIGSRQAAAAIGGGTTAQTSFASLPTGASFSLNYNMPILSVIYPVSVVLEPSTDVSTEPYGLASYAFGSTTWQPKLTGNVFPIFSDLLTQTGYGSIKLATSTDWTTLAGDASLTVRPGGSVTLTEVAAINGAITAHGGNISLTGVDNAGGYSGAPTALTLGPRAMLDVSGRWVNDSGRTGDQIQGSAFINGGSVSLMAPTDTIATSGGVNTGTLTDGTNLHNDTILSVVDDSPSIVLNAGSVIDASSGGYVGTTGKLKTDANGLPSGAGGSVSLQLYAPSRGGGSPGFQGNIGASQGVLATTASLSNGATLQPGTAVFYTPAFVDATVTSYTPTDGVARAGLMMNGAIYAFGLNGGGTFTLQAGSVTIDGAASAMSSFTSGPRSGEVVLPTSFFAGKGFGSYNLVSVLGSTIVTANTHLALAEQSYLLGAAGGLLATGAALRNVASVGTLPAGLSQPVSLTLQQNSHIATNTDPFGNPLVDGLSTVNGTTFAGLLIDTGASITTGTSASQQATINLVSTGPLTVLGSLTAPGGAINLVQYNGTGGSTSAQDIWIGPHAVLDVGGVYVPSPRVTAYNTGTVLNGGAITFAGSNLINTANALTTAVVEPGAQFLINGAAATIDIPTGGLTGPRFAVETVWSNGGALQFAVPNLYFAGTVNAHGGAAAAAGGTLTVGNVLTPAAISSYLNVATGTSLTAPSTIVIEPAGLIAANLPVHDAPKTLADLGAAVPSVAGTFLGTDTLNAGGFDSVSLSASNSSGSSIAFNGSVGIAVPGALTLTVSSGQFVLLPSSQTLLPAGTTNPGSYSPPSCGAVGSCIPTIGRTAVTLNAGYVQLVGFRGTSTGSISFPNVADGTLNISAQWIDLERSISLGDVLNANFTSAGAIRLLPDNYGYVSGPGTSSQSVFAGALIAPGNLTLTAAEVYPVSNTDFLLMSTGTIAGANTVAIAQNGVATAPLSAGGGIWLDAQNIIQGGTLWAPLGSLVIGLQNASQVPTAIDSVLFNGSSFTKPIAITQNINLSATSLTSVSAAGLDIPDGYTINGTTWYEGTANNNNLNLGTALNAPPAKSIALFGANITTAGIIDASGGGDIYATEYVSGTGGSRNVLTNYEQNFSNGAFTTQYPDGRQVYALVPTYLAKIAAYDPNFGDYPYFSGQIATNATSGNYINAIQPGTAITIAGGNGIAAGTYTLLPGMYATLPGAYRVVQVAGTASPGAPARLTATDGSQFITGTLTNALTGARTAQQGLFQVQSNAVWTKYSRINITPGTSFFRAQALINGTAVPPLPIDGGVLTLVASNKLALYSSNNFAPGTSDLAPGLSGAGGQVQISAANILVLASDKTVPAADGGYLVLDADQISALGASSVLIGGSAVTSTTGETITANTTNLEVETDAAHPLTGPELILITLAGGTKGLTVDGGSVIAAVGTVPSGTDRNITIGTGTAATASGSLLRVSDGIPVLITRTGATTAGANIAIGTTPGTATLVTGAGVSINGGAVLTVDTSGSGTLAPDLTNPDGSVKAAGVALNAQNYAFSGSLINIGGGSSGLILSPSVIANMSGAASLSLRSASVIDLNDTGGLVIGNAGQAIGTVTFDSAGLYSAGGTTTIDAVNIVLTDSQSTPNTVGALTGSATGTLYLNAGIDGASLFGAGTLTLSGSPVPASGAGFTFGNFANVNLAASRAIAFSGAGSFGATAGANMTLSAPELLVGTGATQSLTTAGMLTIAHGIGTAPGDAFNASNIGGSLALTAGSITDSGVLVARSGKLVLTGTTGNIELQNGASIDARGAAVTVLDQVEFAPAGSVQLIASNAAVTSASGNVSIDTGSSVDVSAIGLGRAGSLAITATGAASLDGTLQGGAAALTDQNGNVLIPAFKDMGGSFALNAGSVSGNLPVNNGFTGSFAVQLGQGDIVVAAGQTLTSGNVLLATNSGNVIVNGIIDASAPTGGTIALYGTGVSSQITDVNNHTYTYISGGVAIGATAQLLARYQGDDPRDPNYANGTSALVQNGGTSTLGTNGLPTSNSYDATGCGGNGGNGCGYENVNAQIITVNAPGGGTQQMTITNAGAINVASGAVFDVSGGPGGADISNTGGTVIIRAPLLANRNVNVTFQGNVVTGANGGPSTGAVLDAYAVWSTTDNNGTAGSTHFDGIIDPAGWFNANGIKIAGTTTSGDVFTPTGAVNSNHINFYQTTLVNFVQDAFGGNTAAVQADFNGASGLTVGSTLHFRPEIDLVSPSTGTGSNGGNITVASNWNLGGVQTAPTASQNAPLTNYQPAYRTLDSTGGDAGEAGVLSLHAANNIAVNATISDGFYETYAAFGTNAATSYKLVADQIANNPAQTSISGTAVYDLNTTSAASLMFIVKGVNDGSFSYDFVAGAALLGGATPSANPNAVVFSTAPVAAKTPSDSFTINGHTTYTDVDGVNPSTSTPLTIDIPSLVRTGTGSISIAAAGNVEFLDTTAPGAIYTAGAAITPSDFTAPASPASYNSSPNGLVSTPAWATRGGAVTVTAMQSIIGIETVIDTGGSQTGVTGSNPVFIQTWGDWYSHAALSTGSLTPFSGTNSFGFPAQQTAAWVNTATFFQGFGALGGGNIVLNAGANISDVSASLPESILVSGGTSLSDPPQTHYYGGGDLLVTTGGNLNSSAFLVGRGSGLIQAGGSVQADTLNPITGAATVTKYVSQGAVKTGSTNAAVPLSLMLAVQDGFVTVSALGALTLGGIYDPASLPAGASVQTQNVTPGASVSWGNLFTSYGPGSGVALASIAGAVTLQTIPSDATAGLFLANDNAGISAQTFGQLLPATLDVAALAGSISMAIIPKGHTSATAALAPIPSWTGQDIGNLDLVAAQSIDLGKGIQMPDLNTGIGQYVGHTSNGTVVNYGNYISPLGIPLANLTEGLHANDPTPAIVASGQNLLLSVGSLKLIKPAEIEAGGSILGVDILARSTDTNINGFAVVLQNNNPTDVSIISAGQDIIGGSYTIYGPGDLLIAAGRNLGPFFPSKNSGGTRTTSGIAAVGNGIDAASALHSNILQLPVVPYLPAKSADINLLFGVGPGVNYAGAVAQYVDPAGSGAAAGISFLPDIASVLGYGNDTAAGWAAFKRLSASRQDLLVQRGFLDFLTRVALDYQDSSSAYYHQYARAYAAIATLFPAAYGYTNNAAGGGGNGAANRAQFGNFNIASSVLETEMGSDINIIGPSGGITVGSAARDPLTPAQEGILTLAGGTIRAFTDGGIVLNQSRIMTEQGGDIDLFSANGDIAAGEGPKTYASNPPVSEICDVNGYCQVNPSGLVTGAGIAAVLTLPGQDPTKSNVSLAAPHGTVDAGAAGIRVSGNLNIVALQILNAFNIQVGGATVGLPTVAGPPVGALTTASNVAGANQVTVPAPSKGNNDRPSIVIVEFIGFGGDNGERPAPQDDKREHRSEGRTQDSDSAYQILGAGEMTAEEARQIITDRRSGSR